MNLRPDVITVTDSGTYYTFHHTKAKELLTRLALSEFSDSIHVHTYSLVDSLTLRISKSDSIIRNLYIQIDNKDKLIEAYQLKIDLADDNERILKASWNEEREKLQFDNEQLKDKVRWRSVENWIWRTVTPIVLLIAIIFSN